MRATPTTMPWYVLVEEQLLKETWTLYTWSFANSKCGGGMWVPQSKFPSQLISCPGIGLCPRILLYKKRWKKMRGVAMVTTLSPSTKCRGKYSQCPAFDIKQSPAGRSPEDHQDSYLSLVWIMLNHASCSLYLSSYALVWMCVMKHILRPF